MSLSGSSFILVNTTREEGYDIQFRFKTTLSNGLLAIGKGSTYYILELVNGKLNLHSSLLNKWEGVFIGSKLSDSNWQKVGTSCNALTVMIQICRSVLGVSHTMAQLTFGAHMFLDALTCVNWRRSFNVFFIILLTFNILPFLPWPEYNLNVHCKTCFTCPTKRIYL